MRIVPLRRFLSEAVEDFLSLDSRILRTLVHLLLRPGEFTLEYLRGRRIRYIPPFRLYLAASVVYFLVLAWMDSRSFFFFTASADSAQAERFVMLLPRLMFLILPAFALLLKAVHLGRRLYLEHLVFALHFHAATFLLLSVHTLLESAALALRAQGSAWAVVLIVVDSLVQLAVFVHLFVALRRVYGRGILVTLLQLFLLLGGYVGLLVLTGAALIQTGRLLAAFD